MASLEELGFENYKDYLATKWWKHLTHRLITLSPNAECFICHKKYSLLLHHVSYENLANEKLYRDVFILCYFCHKDEHFTLFSHKKIPLKEKILRKRLIFLKIIYPVRKFRLGSFLNSIFARIF